MPIEEKPAPAVAAKSGSKLLPVLLTLMGLLLVGLGTSVGYIIGIGALPGSHAGAETIAEAESEPPAKGATAKNKPAKKIAAAKKEPLGEPIFLSLKPGFTGNFNDGKAMRYMQVGLDVMARDKSILDAAEAVMPQLRYQILKTMGNQNNTIYTSEGKDAMLAAILKELRGIVKAEAGTIEAVYYNQFVIQ